MAKAPAEPKAKVEKVVEPKDIQNGVTRPKPGTKTGFVWEVADNLSKEAGAPAPRKVVIATCVEEGINPATASTQYGKWRAYHGLGKEVKPAVDAAPAA